MTALADLGLYPELQKYGATDMSACFSCGNCTAICPLSENDATFPRRMIRYAQVGMKDALLSSKELWSCYHCGECSDSCPTEADPGEFMAAARRYAIASYDRTGLARLMYLRPALGTAFALALAAFFALFMYAAHGPQDTASLAIFTFIPAELIHDTGIVVMILVVLAGLAGVAGMARQIGRREGVGWRSVLGSRAAIARSGRALWSSLGRESLGQVRYRKECESETETVAWYRRRWFIHAVTIWGFLGLLLATGLDYGLALLGIKETGTPVPIWYPVRLLGTVAGLMLVYGTTVMIIDRVRAANRSVARSAPADWTLLALLWITGVTGFGLELALYLPEPPAWGYWVFLLHVAIAMELVLLAPFMKLAHAVYRPVALFFVALAREPLPAPASTSE
ncbi:MAG TPA: 4Fe-4S dicluster domain-containing protein [Candidatus Nanopelagicales bacterium]|nr:4Fe-4S dicluster domain-containing protein [Candidatus Nanopelagicales bacterium]